MVRKLLPILLLTVAVALALMPLDPWLWRTFTLAHPDSFKSSDVHQVFRQAGHLLSWGLVTAALVLAIDFPKPGELPPRNELVARLMVFVSPLLSGGLAEIVKRVVGRERPGFRDTAGAYTFKPFLHAFVDGSNMGLPSSHAAVAFGGAFMLLRLFPGAGIVALLWAIGCAATRVALGAHYVSDVAVGAGLGLLASAICDLALRRAKLR